jgi:hypothetical protein
MRKPETFVNFVSRHAPLNELPVFHTARGTVFEKILETESLSPRPCKVMGKDILYLYWGIPGYRTGDPRSQNKKLSSAPICFLVERGSLMQPFDTFPFDTGAASFTAKQFALEEELELDQYRVTSDSNGPERIAASLYHTISNYLSGHIPEEVSEELSNNLSFSSLKLVEIINSPESNEVDERSAIVEVQHERSIQISADNISAIVAPDIIAASALLVEIGQELDAEIIPYPFKRDSNPSRTIRIEEVTCPPRLPHS